MMAILLAEEIACNKAAGEEATWKLEVSQADFSKAVNRLRQKGYPKARYTGMGDVFRKSVSSLHRPKSVSALCMRFPKN